MGIESDQLVYDYLSRVGDVAQQQQLPSGTRMRLVSSLRNEIDRQRGKFGSDSPAAVRRILGRLGDPEVLVRTASTGGAQSPLLPEPPPSPAVPEQRTRRGGGARSRWVKEPREPKEPRGSKGARGSKAESAVPEQASWDLGAPPPHLAGMDELTQSGPGMEPDWWRVQSGPMGAGLSVPGFVGGVEIPEILKAPHEGAPDKPVGSETEQQEATQAQDPEKTGGRGWRPKLRRRNEEKRRGGGGGTGGGGLSNPFLLLAAALLVAGAFLGSWLALGGGWLLAYASRTMSRAEAKLVVFGLPGVSVAGGLVWLWGRLNDRWGEAIPKDGMNQALQDTWPVVLRTAAVASALYLVWRSRRRRG